MALILPFEVTRWPVALVPALAWLLSARKGGKAALAPRATAMAFGLWIVVAEIFSSIHSPRGYLWLAGMLVAVVLPILFSAQIADAALVSRTFLTLAAALGAYALVEAFLLKSNPVYGSLYAAGPDPITVTPPYRATTLLGHPLVNAAVFGTALVLSVDKLLVSRRLRGDGLRLILIAGGLVATLSRGATAAAGFGVLVLILFQNGPRIATRRRLSLLAGMVLAAGVFVVVLAARSETNAAQKSVTVRSLLVQETAQVLAGHELVGVGPGVVQDYRRKYGLLPPNSVLQASDTALESTYAEFAAGIGIPGLGLFIALLASCVAVGLRRAPTRGAACALLTFGISIGTFKTEGHVALFVFLGLLMSLSARPSCHSDARP